MKQQEPQKKVFFDLLNLAVRKGEKVVSQKPAQKKGAGYSGKRTHQHKTGGALRK